MKLSGKDFDFPQEADLNYSDSENEYSVDKTYKPSSNHDKCFSDNDAAMNMRQSKDLITGNVKSERQTVSG